MDVVKVVAELRQAVDDCAARGLAAASDWASELLNAIPPHHRRHPPPHAPPPSRPPPTTSTPLRPPADPDADASNDSAMDLTEDAPRPPPEEADDPDRIRRAQGLFARRELMRVGDVLRGCGGGVARFMRLYTRYLTSDKHANDRWAAHQNIKLKWTPAPVNDQLTSLLSEMEPATTDPFLLFLKGIVLFQLKKRAEAIEALILSLRSYPCNWSCWLQLALCIDNVEEFTRLQDLLPSHFMTTIFSTKMSIDLFTATVDGTGAAVDALLAAFPASAFLKTQKAMIMFNVHEYEAAEEIFDEIHAADPARLDHMDIYSNVLYVMDKATKLGDVARKMVKVNRDRPEVCCLIGNYYSMRGEHEKAVLYFRRALALDKSYVAAWTLVGHEYVEMKNSHAAIEAYRRAVDLNRKDYRAWYGLGQTYELLDMHFYALHYYQRATALKPYDTRMWQALATCYTALKRPTDTLVCLKRALLGDDADPISLYTRIATLLDAHNERALAATYHRRIVAACLAASRPISDSSKSKLALAQRVLETHNQNPHLYHLEPERESVALVMSWMEGVRESSCEEAQAAGEMVRKLNVLMRAEAMAAAMGASAEGVAPPQPPPQPVFRPFVS